MKKIIIIANAVILILLLVGCAQTKNGNGEDMKSPTFEPLTPEQMLEYIEIFSLETDITREQILAGERPRLTATEETAELMYSINFFTVGMQGDLIPNENRPVGTNYPLSQASEEFVEQYRRGQRMRQRYTGHLTEHWDNYLEFGDQQFLRVQHVVYFPEEMYWFYKNLPYEIQRRIHVVVDGMPLMYYIELIEAYRLGWDKGPGLDFDGSGNIIRSELESWNTERTIAQRHDIFWNIPTYYRSKELMQEFGLSDENPITFEWIIANPQDAYSLVTVAWGQFGVFPIMRNAVSDEVFERVGIPILPPWFEADD